MLENVCARVELWLIARLDVVQFHPQILVWHSVGVCSWEGSQSQAMVQQFWGNKKKKKQIQSIGKKNRLHADENSSTSSKKLLRSLLGGSYLRQGHTQLLQHTSKFDFGAHVGFVYRIKTPAKSTRSTSVLSLTFLVVILSASTAVHHRDAPVSCPPCIIKHLQEPALTFHHTSHLFAS